jgi:hypothetical protein
VSDTVLIGRISPEFERAVSDLGSAVGITRDFCSDVDCRWPEDMVAMRDDPDVADELDPWLPTLIAVAVDAVGSTGGYLAHQMTESTLGATWLAKQAGDDWFHLPPWIIGDTVGDDEDAARAEEHEIGIFMYWHSDRKPPYNDITIAGWNYDLEDLLQRPPGGPIRVVANSRPFRGATTGPAARLAASCRHAVLGARVIDPAQRLVHFTSALEALVQVTTTRWSRTFKVGVARLIDADPPTAGHHRKTLGRIYEERSRILHEGFTRSTVEVMAARAAEVKTYLVDSALKVASLVERWHELGRRPARLVGDLRSEGWSERWSPPAQTLRGLGTAGDAHRAANASWIASSGHSGSRNGQSYAGPRFCSRTSSKNARAASCSSPGMKRKATSSDVKRMSPGTLHSRSHSNRYPVAP